MNSSIYSIHQSYHHSHFKSMLALVKGLNKKILAIMKIKAKS